MHRPRFGLTRHHPAAGFAQGRAFGEKRGGVPIWAKAHECKVEADAGRASGRAPLIAQEVFVVLRGQWSVRFAMNAMHVLGKDRDSIEQSFARQAIVALRVVWRHAALVT